MQNLNIEFCQGRLTNVRLAESSFTIARACTNLALELICPAIFERATKLLSRAEIFDLLHFALIQSNFESEGHECNVGRFIPIVMCPLKHVLVHMDLNSRLESR